MHSYHHCGLLLSNVSQHHPESVCSALPKKNFEWFSHTEKLDSLPQSFIELCVGATWRKRPFDPNIHMKSFWGSCRMPQAKSSYTYQYSLELSHSTAAHLSQLTGDVSESEEYFDAVAYNQFW